MRPIKTIMVSTDLTPDSRPAHKAGAFLADQFKAGLVVFHVLGELDPKYSVLVEDVARHMRKEAEEAMADLKGELKAINGASVKTVIREGSLIDQIADVKKAEGVDLMVLGTGAVRTGSPNRLGLTAKRIAHRIPIDMVFARPGSEGPWSNILMATDFSDCAGHALNRACQLAKMCDARTLTIVHSFEVPQTFHRLGLEESVVVPKMVKHAEKQMAEWLAGHKDKLGGLEVVTVVRTGEPAATVCEEARNRKAQLVLVGSQGRTASAAVLLGNVAERIIRDAPCSVWTERAEGQGMTFAKAIARIMGIE